MSAVPFAPSLPSLAALLYFRVCLHRLEDEWAAVISVQQEPLCELWSTLFWLHPARGTNFSKLPHCIQQEWQRRLSWDTGEVRRRGRAVELVKDPIPSSPLEGNAPVSSPSFRICNFLTPVSATYAACPIHSELSLQHYNLRSLCTPTECSLTFTSSRCSQPTLGAVQVKLCSEACPQWLQPQNVWDMYPCRMINNYFIVLESQTHRIRNKISSSIT